MLRHIAICRATVALSPPVPVSSTFLSWTSSESSLEALAGGEAAPLAGLGGLGVVDVGGGVGLRTGVLGDL
eukprot:CAMPEP_0114567572 /NCGR_PEP_ID=MMETSP0114-20121206/15555_1 /TAXON_ID=31324 /ORGANISM="Goniomonas sp, Strain m" /LENGTH=70 /DNA_ID=CAMNT_0001754175 /DNA_START=285 /DNA_END=493 /DNA_ORIENTATION=-